MSSPALLNNRYQLDHPLGTGGMAVVYRAQDLMLERTVAIKVLREDFSNDPDFRERFRQEAKAAANLTHPNIVTIHDFGLDAGRLFIVMEYVPGTELKAIIQQRGRFTVEEALPLMIQACAGIGYAHRAGLVHCDVKPYNILITPDQRVKVTDFGIARALASIHPDEKTDVVWGSPQYFSPEQAAGGAPSPASDVYSLGVVLYEMLTGRLPFLANTPTELARMHRDVTPTAPHQINPAIPLALEQIILKVLSKEPSARYRTADQLGRVLILLNNPAAANPSAAPSFPEVAATIPPTAPPTRQVPAPMPPLHRPSANSHSRQFPGQVAPPATAPARPVSPPAQRPPPVQPPLPVRPVRPEPETEFEAESEENPLNIDWLTWGLGLLALTLVLGLIPFWIWVYYQIAAR